MNEVIKKLLDEQRKLFHKNLNEVLSFVDESERSDFIIDVMSQTPYPKENELVCAWVSVKDKLPTDETDVFVYGHAYDNHISYHGVGCLYCGHWVDSDYTNLDNEYGIGITHWMEMTEPRYAHIEDFDWT
jgi:hypothetical protein